MVLLGLLGYDHNLLKTYMLTKKANLRFFFCSISKSIVLHSLIMVKIESPYS
jgi:hypothetical protein